MKKLIVLFTAATALNASAAYTNTFDTDLGLFTPGATGGAAWSASHGGSMELSFTSGWKDKIALLNLNSDAALSAEFQLAMTNGGKIKYTIRVVHDEILGGAPGWFESIYIGNSDGVWDQQFGAAAGQTAMYGAAAFPAGGVTILNVEYPIEGASGPISDRIAQFKAGSGWNEIFLGMNSGGGTYTSGKYYVDNFSIEANTVVVETVPPVMGIERAKTGMNFFASGGGQYDRQSLRTVGAGYSWIGRPGPVTYSFSFSDYPKIANLGAFIYFAPGNTLATDTAPDWQLPVCAVASINGNADGTGSMRFSYKKHVAESNGAAGHEYWVPDDGTGQGGALVTVNSTRMEGTWSVTFTSNTNFTLTAPDGQSATGAMLAPIAADYAGPMHVYFGMWPTQVANIGSRVIVSSITISGVADPAIDEDFGGATVTTDLEKSGASLAGIVHVNSTTPYWLTWTLPPGAGAFELEHSTKLSPFDTWEPLTTGGLPLGGTRKVRLVLDSELHPGPKDIFRLRKP